MYSALLSRPGARCKKEYSVAVQTSSSRTGSCEVKSVEGVESTAEPSVPVSMTLMLAIRFVGVAVGGVVGCSVDGLAVGDAVGNAVGWMVGFVVGPCVVGALLGFIVGASVDGAVLGLRVGVPVMGARVG
jgi:hypothetical protein